jgi:hypothetical protein
VGWSTWKLSCVLESLVRCGQKHMEVEMCLGMSGKMWAGVHAVELCLCMYGKVWAGAHGS